MRYLMQFLVPALVVIIVALVFLRNRRAAAQSGNSGDSLPSPRILSTGAFIAILIVSGLFTVALIYTLLPPG